MAAESLAQRIKAEFDSKKQQQAQDEAQRIKNEQAQKSRIDQFNKTCEDLKSVWRPRLDEFAKHFGEQVKVTPKIEPELRQATAEFMTDMANVTLALSVVLGSATDKIILNYDLRIIPMFMDYERTARLEMPLNTIDRDAVGRWIDDRLVAAVKTYLSLQDNEFYRQRALIEDPVSKVRFAKDKAVAKLDHSGKTVYFASQQSHDEYKRKHQLDHPPTPPAAAAPADKPAVVTKPGHGQTQRPSA